MSLVPPSKGDEPDLAGRAAAKLQYEVAQYVETKTVTTTTTTKRSFPPLFIRQPRPLEALDAKEYPLAQGPTPAGLRKFSLDLNDNDDEFAWSFAEPAYSPVSSEDHVSPAREAINPPCRGTPVPELQSKPPRPATESQTRRSRRHMPNSGASPSAGKASQRSSRSHAPTSHVSDRLRRAVSNGARDRITRQTSSQYLATPDRSDSVAGSTEWPQRLRPLNVDRLVEPSTSNPSQSTAAYDAASPAGSESQTVFSSSVATPPITDADVEPFADPLDDLRPVSSRASQPPRSSITVAAGDASLPSPRLSPTLAAAQLHTTETQDDEIEEEEEEEEDPSFSKSITRSSRRRWIDENQDTQSTIDLDMELALVGHDSPSNRDRGSFDRSSGLLDTRSMLESFDAMPNEMKTFMMYQFLRRCPRKTLHMVADVVNPALKCDFLKQLPVELGLHVLSFLDHRDLCRAAQVSKHWRNLIDTNETGWKELLDRDGFKLAPGELKKAIKQGWGWQDPEGPEGAELDVSLQNRLTSTEAELWSPGADGHTKTRSSKRKRLEQSHSHYAQRKRRVSAREVVKDDSPSSPPKLFKPDGPISAAGEAAAAVSDPQIGLPSLRRLHLFKSLYRRHYMIRQSWTSGKVKPGHVAFAAHPRHVITCLQFDDDKIITGSDDTLIHVYDTKTGKLRKKLEGHEGGVWALQYEGNILVSGSTDRSVRVWDIEKGLCTQVFFGHTSTVRCLQILMPTEVGKTYSGEPIMMPPNPLIITGSRDSQLRVWRLPEAGSRRYIQTGPPANDAECPYFVRILPGHTHSVRSIAAHGDTLVSGSYDATVRVWRISTGEALHVLHGHTQKVYSVVLDHKRNRCISGSMDSFVKIWDLDTGACLHTLEGHTLLVGLLDLRDERLVSAAADSTLRIWDPENGKCKNTLMAHTGAITCFQHDGRKVISGSEKTVKMWDIQTGDCIQDLLTDLGGVWQVKFDERRCVAAVQRDNLTYVEILDFGAVRDGKPPEELGKRILLNGPEVQHIIEEEP
ncbi:hypothetical protein M406DRAFT_99963 [Cryphonectria parasitica EP155]|uniref:F-box domain-containing protein n=1 Tax=Cryphonectria parasitica (strain ATCC 38755 / EP155) TaxID=660469 RepID=A0A9P5CLE2_CRYP1|nr:uncharacterized protein M406DRAFT_99963 [Cryphonectria parasitica EP155]KAF3761931.1 hypothetical protein M406DRAFT_99963 [Cryphonectria parasitica EP155]